MNREGKDRHPLVNVSSETAPGQEDSVLNTEEKVPVLDRGEGRAQHVLAIKGGDNRVQHVRFGVSDVCLPQRAPHLIRTYTRSSLMFTNRLEDTLSRTTKVRKHVFRHT